MIGLKDIIEGTGGRPVRAGADSFAGVCSDSRSIKNGELFVPLSGPNFDGHDFIAAAFASGAAGALVQRGKAVDAPDGACLIEVADTLRALQDLASHIRLLHADTPLVGVTGSNGKTTTKEMMACALGVRGPVLKNEGNLNNEIGLPLSLTRLESGHWAAVLEMGMSAPGEIARLAEIARPTVGVITNIGAAHLKGLGSVEAVAAAKAELVEALQPEGRAVLNADDPMLSELIKRLGDRAVTFGLGSGSMFTAESMTETDAGMSFRLNAPDGSVRLELSARGTHNVLNALAAAAASWPLGLSVEETASGLSRFRPVRMRMELMQVGGVTVINDAYNANPGSMAAALDTLASFRDRRKMAVLGEMLELGESSAQSHYNVGRLAGSEGLSLLVLVGEHAPEAARGAADAGMPDRDIIVASGAEEAAIAVLSRASEGDCLLVKGSRGMRMERVIELMGDKGGIR